MKKYLHVWNNYVLYLSLSVALLLVMAGAARAQNGARLYLQPVESGPDTLTVNVVAEDVNNLYGAEFELKYDPAIFSVQDADPQKVGLQIEPGSLFPAGQGFVVANQVDEVAGTITFAFTLLNPAPALHGAGPLGKITFTSLNQTPTTIQILEAKLVTKDLQTLPSQTEALVVEHLGQPAKQSNLPQEVAQAEQQPNNLAVTTVDNSTVGPTGQAETLPQPPPDDFPWWAVAAAIIVVGFLGLGAFVFLVEVDKPQPQLVSQPKQLANRSPSPQAGQKANYRPSPAQQTPRTRPSAFK